MHQQSKLNLEQLWDGSFADFLVHLVQPFILVVTIQIVLVNQIGYGWFEFSRLHAQQPSQKLLILLDSTQQNAALRFPLLILLDDPMDGIGVFLPDLLSDEGRVSQHEIEVVMVFLRNCLWVVEVVLEVVGVVMAEFLIELGGDGSTSKRMQGCCWFGLSMAQQMEGVDMKQQVWLLAAWLARKRMVFSEYQYWLKSPFSLFFSRNSLAFFYILIIKTQIFSNYLQIINPFLHHSD